MYLMLTDEMDRRNLVIVDSVQDAKRLCKYDSSRFYGYEHIEPMDSINVDIIVNEAIINAQDKDFFDKYCCNCDVTCCLDCQNNCDLSRFE